MKPSRAEAFAVALALVVSALTLVACEEDGPAEKAGEKLDKAIEEVAE